MTRTKATITTNNIFVWRDIASLLAVAGLQMIILRLLLAFVSERVNLTGSKGGISRWSSFVNSLKVGDGVAVFDRDVVSVIPFAIGTEVGSEFELMVSIVLI